MASQEELDRARELRDIENDRVGISGQLLDDLRSSSNAVSDRISLLKFEKLERSEIRSITRDLNKIAKDNYTISLSELGSSKNLAKIQKDQANLQTKIISASQLRDKFSTSTVESEFEIAIALEAQVQEAQKLSAELSIIEEEAKNISNNFGVKGFAVTEDLVGAIPGLRQFKGSFKEAADSARSVAASGGTSTKAFAAGAKSLGKAATAAAPLLLLTGLIDAFLKLDTGAGKIGKQLGISYQESLKLQGSLSDTAAISGDIFITTENLRKSFLAINGALGLRANIDSELLKTQTQLVEKAGYSVEAATKISTLSAATGQSSEELTTEFLGQAAALNAQEGILLSEKQLLESINNLSGQTLATFAAQPEALAKSVFAASKLGLELSQVEKIADGLLNIESSISNEFEAEVILGRQLNLEKARLFALQNDLAGVANELTNQGIDQASFADMNRIQQQAAASALGMSVNEMGNMLIEQKAISALSGVEGKTAQERFNNLVAEKGLLEAKKQLGDETLASQLASVSTQEKFAQALSKLQEVFVSIVTPLMPLLSAVGSLATGIGKILSMIPLELLAGLVGFMVGGPLGAAIGVGAALSQRVDDGMAPASKGPFTITDGFGETAITAKGDSLAVSPNISREDNRNNNTQLDYEKLANAIAMGAEKGTSRANITTNLDGAKVSNRIQAPLAMGTRKYSV